MTAWLASAAGTGLISFIVLYAVESGPSQRAAGLLLGGLSLAAATSRIALGLASDRSGGDPLGPVAPMLLAGASGLVLLVVGEPAASAARASDHPRSRTRRTIVSRPFGPSGALAGTFIRCPPLEN